MSTKNYIFYCTVDNFELGGGAELDFGDFKIITVRQGLDAARWRERLHCKGVPQHILEKSFPGYVMQNNDFSGVDNIRRSMWELLTFFRLFKTGDIGFGNYLIEDKDDVRNSMISLASPADISFPKYNFNGSEIGQFNQSREEVRNRPWHKNKFFQFALSYFMRGIDGGFSHNEALWGRRVVDYFIALESLFLIDGEKYFLRRTIAKRIREFLSDDASEDLVKNMYDERSKVVHGADIESGGSGNIKQEDKEKFERLLRKVFLKLFDHDFHKKEEMIQFMRKLFTVPKEVLKIMSDAQWDANRKLDKFDKGAEVNAA